MERKTERYLELREPQKYVDGTGTNVLTSDKPVAREDYNRPGLPTHDSNVWGY